VTFHHQTQIETYTDMSDRRTERVDEQWVHSWSRINPLALAYPDKYRYYDIEIVIREGARIYATSHAVRVSAMSRDTFVMLFGVLKAQPSAMTWPYIGQGITDDQPGPHPNEWIWKDT
jgi:hypothetical protein